MEPLATPGQLETHLGRTLDPAVAEQALDMASAAVRGYCGWNLSREDTTFHVEAGTGPLITLPTLHLVVVSDVRCGGNPVDLTLYPINFSLKGQVWGTWAPTCQYELDVTHGYDPVPDVLTLVTLDLAARIVENPQGLTSATTGQVSRTWGTSGGGSTMSALHERLLDRFSLFNP